MTIYNQLRNSRTTLREDANPVQADACLAWIGAIGPRQPPGKDQLEPVRRTRQLEVNRVVMHIGVLSQRDISFLVAECESYMTRAHAIGRLSGNGDT